MFNITSLVLKLPLWKQTGPLQKDRTRTNILMPVEQPLILLLCRIMPAWVTPDMLTAFGMAGSAVVATGLALATFNPWFLLLAIAGFFIQWFGDSLDGRLAYFRNTPRKWYGFSLDLTMDWISTTLIGIGFYYYLPAGYKVLAFVLVATYGWAILMAAIKYKLTDRYRIDSGLMGPTEFRLVLCLLLVVEIFVPGSLILSGALVTMALIGINIKDFFLLLRDGNKKDRAVRKEAIAAKQRA